MNRSAARTANTGEVTRKGDGQQQHGSVEEILHPRRKANLLEARHAGPQQINAHERAPDVKTTWRNCRRPKKGACIGGQQIADGSERLSGAELAPADDGADGCKNTGERLIP